MLAEFFKLSRCLKGSELPLGVLVLSIIVSSLSFARDACFELGPENKIQLMSGNEYVLKERNAYVNVRDFNNGRNFKREPGFSGEPSKILDDIKYLSYQNFCLVHLPEQTFDEMSEERRKLYLRGEVYHIAFSIKLDIEMRDEVLRGAVKPDSEVEGLIKVHHKNGKIVGVEITDVSTRQEKLGLYNATHDDDINKDSISSLVVPLVRYLLRERPEFSQQFQNMVGLSFAKEGEIEVSPN